MSELWKELRDRLSSERGKWGTQRGYWVNAAEALLAEVDRLETARDERDQLRAALRRIRDEGHIFYAPAEIHDLVKKLLGE